MTAELSACEIAFGGQMTTVSWPAGQPASQPTSQPVFHCLFRIDWKPREHRITDFTEFYQMIQNTPIWFIRRTLQIFLGQLLLSR